MQVTQLDSKGLKKRFKVVVDAATINSQTETELRAAGERVKIPGFRPGFIPMKVLQARYGKSVQADVLKQVINQSTTKVITERKLRPAITPNVNIEEYNEGGDLAYSIEFDAFPEVPELKFDKIALDRNTFEITEKDVDETMQTIASRHPKLNRAKDGAKAQLGNVVFIDFKGKVDGVAFDGGTAKDFKLELGSKQLIDNFEEQLLGLKEGEEKVVKVTFPENYPGGNLAGKKADFEVVVKELYTKEDPAIDDEFAKARGFADLKAFHEVVRSQITREYDQVVRGQVKKLLFDTLDEQYDFDLPETMVEMEFNSIWERLQQARAEGEKIGEDQSEEELKEEYRQIARRRVKLGILLAEVGNRNKLQVTSEELNRALMQQVSMFPGQEKKVMEFYRNNPDRVQDLRGPIMEEKAVDFILGKVKFTDKKVALSDLSSAGEEEDDAPKKKTSKEAKDKPKAAAKKKSAE